MKSDFEIIKTSGKWKLSVCRYNFYSFKCGCDMINTATGKIYTKDTWVDALLGYYDDDAIYHKVDDIENYIPLLAESGESGGGVHLEEVGEVIPPEVESGE
jgi:hypothetical protein